MPQTQSSSNSINSNSSTDFANDNFCGNFYAFSPDYFPSETFKNSLSSAQSSSLKARASLFTKTDASGPYLNVSGGFINQDQLTGSAYYKSRLGFNPNTDDASSIIAGGDITTNSINDINIKVSNLTATSGTIISQIGNITIENGIDSTKSLKSSGKSNSSSYYVSRVLSRAKQYKISLKGEMNVASNENYLNLNLCLP